MLLILSENHDISTKDVVDWLIHDNTQYVRVNDKAKMYLNCTCIKNEGTNWVINAEQSDIQFSKRIEFEKISAYWYRRGYINLPPFIPQNETLEGNILISKFQRYLDSNHKELIEFINDSLVTKKHVGAYKDNFKSKLINQQAALDVGLNIPATVIVSSKNEIICFKKKYNKIITKGIRNNSFNINPEVAISTLTQLVTEADIKFFPETFSPSLIQEYIEKSFELRVFYWAGKCYSTAILSQQDEQTKVDFRNYNGKKPNRIVPYKLPIEIEKKLIKFMNNVGMESGSIDIVVSLEMNYYFLEVNPVGQFSWISKSCNLQLERIIANYFKLN